VPEAGKHVSLALIIAVLLFCLQHQYSQFQIFFINKILMLPRPDQSLCLRRKSIKITLIRGHFISFFAMRRYLDLWDLHTVKIEDQLSQLLIPVRAQPDVDPQCSIQINSNRFPSLDVQKRGEHCTKRSRSDSAHASFKIKWPLFGFENAFVLHFSTIN
jgi:hypothetical protein